MVVHACNPCPWRAKQMDLCEFKSSQSFIMRPYHQNQSKTLKLFFLLTISYMYEVHSGYCTHPNLPPTLLAPHPSHHHPKSSQLLKSFGGQAVSFLPLHEDCSLLRSPTSLMFCPQVWGWLTRDWVFWNWITASCSNHFQVFWSELHKSFISVCLKFFPLLSSTMHLESWGRGFHQYSPANDVSCRKQMLIWYSSFHSKNLCTWHGIQEL